KILHYARPAQRGRVAPRREGRGGGLDRLIDRLLIGESHPLGDLPIGRVEDLAEAGGGRYFLAIDPGGNGGELNVGGLVHRRTPACRNNVPQCSMQASPPGRTLRQRT